MMKKAQMGPKEVVTIISYLIVFAVILYLVFPAIIGLVRQGTEEAVCNWTIFLSGIFRAGGSSPFPIECKAKEITVYEGNISNYLPEAKTNLEKFSGLEKYKRFNDKFKDMSKSQKEYEYAVDEFVAKELDSCWRKVVRGKLPMFDEWWNLVDVPLLGLRNVDAKSYDAEFKSKWSALGLIDIWGPPTFCIVCANIKFDDALIAKLKDSEVDSLNDWLNHHSVNKFGDSYYKYLVEGQTIPSTLFIPRYGVKDLKTTNSIIYKRVNPHASTAWLQKAKQLVWKTDGELPPIISELKLVPYEDVSKPYTSGGESCVYVIE